MAQINDVDLFRFACIEGTTTVTKDTYLAERELVTRGRLNPILIRGENLKSQIRQLAQDLILSSDSACSLYFRWNETLISLSQEVTWPLLRECGYRTQKELVACAQLRRVYWRGTERPDIREDLAPIVALAT